MNPDPALDWTYLVILALAGLALAGWSVVVMINDARRRGYDPRLTAIVAVTLWPLSLFVWLFARTGRHLAPRGFGSPWG